MFASLGSTLKSPINSVFSYFLLYASNALSISPRWVATLILLGLNKQHINHLHDFRSISMNKTSMLSGKTWHFGKTVLILLRTYSNNPPPCLLRSYLNGILKPSIWNCCSGKESSSLVSVIIKTSNTSDNTDLKISNLSLIELILIWPIINFLGYFDRENFRTDPTDPLEQWSRLITLKSMKGSTFDVSVILLPLSNFFSIGIRITS